MKKSCCHVPQDLLSCVISYHWMVSTLARQAKNTSDTVFGDPDLFSSNLNYHILQVKPIHQPAQKLSVVK
jgi:hypothetical protein